MKNRIIPFSPPDITRAEIDELVDTLRSGWITTGPKTKQFEKEIAKYCNTKKAVCLNSATAGLELVLRLFDIGVGDEVITTPYTFAATANVILHVGAKPVFVDIKKDQFNIDPKEIERAITKKTKAVITVDFGGFPCDYDEILDILENNKRKYCPKKHTNQQLLEKPLFLADAAHSFGAEYKSKKLGGVADFSVFSFHAVKNLTTAEGGAVTFNSLGNINKEHIYNKLMLLSLHGQ
ncbi:MAG: DegT/DnrJ/EryC1/StrS family aminotransferase, partial [Spirochaetes bacterium]|nr:DegT/DnrJ/EryC1/StrS family aminotransferase [Spirochaetota bacterium]